jgi:hypothetical protein
MAEPVHIAVIVKQVLFDLANKGSSQVDGKVLLSRLRTQIRQKGIRRRNYERKVQNG